MVTNNNNQKTYQTKKFALVEGENEYIKSKTVAWTLDYKAIKKKSHKFNFVKIFFNKYNFL